MVGKVVTLGVFVCSAVIDGVKVLLAVTVGVSVTELVGRAVDVVLGVARCDAV
jgi:hypothetical protein